MASAENRDTAFVGSVPDVYERLMVPMIFQHAADRLAGVIASHSPDEILETAAGTGVLTRALIAACPAARITATDLNQPMLDAAEVRSPAAAQVQWRQADALALPFEDSSFDTVACQFGAMFFPDRVAGYREASRVLRPGGAFVFNVWDRIENNEVAHVITSALVEAAPDNPLSFLSRKPHGYFDLDLIRADLEEAGLRAESITPVDATSTSTVADAAIAYCQGTPLRAEIDGHDRLGVEDATRIAAAALLRHFGPGPIDAPIRSFEIVATPAG